MDLGIRCVHLTRAGEGEDVAAPLLLSGCAHALQGQGLGHSLAGAAHAAAGVHAQQDGPSIGRRPDLPPLGVDLGGEFPPAVALVALQRLLRQLGIEQQAGLAHRPAPGQQGSLRSPMRRILRDACESVPNVVQAHRADLHGAGESLSCTTLARVPAQRWMYDRANRPRSLHAAANDFRTAGSMRAHAGLCMRWRSTQAGIGGAGTSEGRRREISSERVRPRVSCASRVVRSSPGRPRMSRYCAPTCMQHQHAGSYCLTEPCRLQQQPRGDAPGSCAFKASWLRPLVIAGAVVTSMQHACASAWRRRKHILWLRLHCCIAPVTCRAGMPFREAALVLMQPAHSWHCPGPVPGDSQVSTWQQLHAQYQHCSSASLSFRSATSSAEPSPSSRFCQNVVCRQMCFSS